MIPFPIHFDDAWLTILFSLGLLGFAAMARMIWLLSVQIAILQVSIELTRKDLKNTILHNGKYSAL